MSELIAVIDAIETHEHLNIVSLRCNDTPLKMMTLDLSDETSIGKKVLLGCKPSAVALAKSFEGVISFSNRLECRIDAIKEGKLVTLVTLSFASATLESLITSQSLKRMQLRVGDSITAFIKASELSITKLFNEKDRDD